MFYLRLRRIYLIFPLIILLSTVAIAVWLFQHIDINSVGLVYEGISAKSFLSHSASNFAFYKAINSTSIVDRVMQV